MAKEHGQDGFDILEEARLRAEHNMNPYYWLSRIPRGGPVRWRFNRGESAVVGLVSMVVLVFVLWTLPGALRNGQADQIVLWFALLGGALAMELAVILSWRPASRQKPKKKAKARHRKRSN